MKARLSSADQPRHLGDDHAAPRAACRARACRCRRSRNASSAATRCAYAPRSPRLARTISTILRLVVPRTIESSTRITRRPCSTERLAECFSFTPEMADVIGRLDEGAADIVVADDAKLERHAAFLRIAHGGGHAGVRHRHDDVGRHVRLARQFGADPLARVVDRHALHHGVGAREIDIFEQAEPLAGARRTASCCGRPDRR